MKEEFQIKFGRAKILIAFSETDKREEIEELVLDAFSTLSDFFGSENIPDGVKINLIYSREEFNTENGRDETPSWMVGFARKNVIHIFSPNVIEKFSPEHPKSSFQPLLIHELTHIVISSFNKKIPIWLNEGLPLNVAQQEKYNKIKNGDWDFFINASGKINFDEFAKHGGYRISYWLVKTLLEIVGKHKIIEFLKSPDEYDPENPLGIPKEKLISETKRYICLVS